MSDSLQPADTKGNLPRVSFSMLDSVFRIFNRVKLAFRACLTRRPNVLAINGDYRSHTNRKILSSDTLEDDAEIRQCVYCLATFAENNETPLTGTEAKEVPKLCKIHFQNHIKREYLKEQQDPRHICNRCTSFLRAQIKVCHYTACNPLGALDPNYARCSKSMREEGRKFKLMMPIEPGGPYWYMEYYTD